MSLQNVLRSSTTLAARRHGPQLLRVLHRPRALGPPVEHQQKSAALIRRAQLYSPQQYQQQQIRAFSWWRIPVYIATASKGKRRLAALGTASGLFAIGSILGPAFWIVLGGSAALVSWRVWRATSHWWDIIQNSNLAPAANSLFGLLRSQVGSHRAAEQLRQLAIDQVLSWGATEQGHRALVDELGMDHIRDLVYFPAHSIRTSDTDINGKKKKMVEVEFWAQDNRTADYRGGSCVIRASAVVEEGRKEHLRLQDVRVSAPGWHAEESVPLSPPPKVIEGEYRDLD